MTSILLAPLGAAALLLGSMPALAQRPSPPPTPRPTRAPTAAPQTASAATANPAAATAAVRQALRAALASQPAVRNAVRAEVLRQLRAHQPVARIDGVWATAIDMGKVYGVPTVRTALATVLPGGGGPQIDAAVLDPNRIGIAFTQAELGSLMGPMVADVMATLGVDAIKGKMTEGVGVLILAGIVGAGAAITLVLPTLVDGSTWADWLGYGSNSKKEEEDNDYDDDGVPDDEDNYPADPNLSICDCSGRGGIFFGTRAPREIVSAVLASFNQLGAQARVATSLGTVRAGVTAPIRIAVP